MRSIHQYIARVVADAKPGTFIFPLQFKALGADKAIGMALRRLTVDKALIKLAHGIYITPGKKVSLYDIAEAIAARERCRIRPAGALARYKLGLLKKSPANLEFSTDGAPRKVKVNNCYIIFRRCIARKMMQKGSISALVIEVLEEAGQDSITRSMVIKLRKLLEKENPVVLEHDLLLAPAWIPKLFLTNG
ncbi:MAG TPA: DUF6088 family protein [Chitinophagaceae bacterium]|nr:DUF6088 family protein [Chitinophagaceae bacterium]